MKLSHAASGVSAVFDEPNLVSCVGLVPVVALADRVGLRTLTQDHLTVPEGAGHAAGAKVTALVAGMQVQIEVPRDTDGTFDPVIGKKRQRRLTGVDAIVLSP